MFFLLFVFPFFLSGCFDKKEEVRFEPLSEAMQKEIEYGKELIAHTARYLGPKGTGKRYLNARTNCQNCHLDAGIKSYGINLQTVHARYPDYRAREGKVLTAEDRVNNCMERPMNGNPLPLDSREMRAILSYFRFLAQGIPTGSRRKGDFLNEMITIPTRAADPKKGELIFKNQCVQCHGENGQGQLTKDGVEYFYPPLWGEESYNVGSSMHRNIKLAAFIRANMPLGATSDKPRLSNEEAFDVAAFINDERVHPRPKSKWNDYPRIDEKPIDYPFGPYIDSFSEEAHRFGPYGPIIEELRKANRVAYY